MNEQENKQGKKLLLVLFAFGFGASWAVQYSLLELNIIPSLDNLVLDQRNRFLQDAEYLGTHTDCETFLYWHENERVMTGFTQKLVDKMLDCGGSPFPSDVKPLDIESLGKRSEERR